MTTNNEDLFSECPLEAIESAIESFKNKELSEWELHLITRRVNTLKAATAEANKRIAELDSEIAELKVDINEYIKISGIQASEITELQASNNRLQAKLTAEKEYVNELLKSSNHLFVENEQLKASNNYLREALESAKPVYTTANDAQVKKGYAESGAIKHYTIEANVLHEAISTTPAESLQAHDDEVIERCAQVCFSEGSYFACNLAEKILALKEVTK